MEFSRFRLSSLARSAISSVCARRWCVLARLGCRPPQLVNHRNSIGSVQRCFALQVDFDVLPVVGGVIGGLACIVRKPFGAKTHGSRISWICLRKTLVEPVSPMHRGVFFEVSYRTDWLLNVHLRSGREQVLSGRQAPVQHEASHPICEREFRTTSHSRSLRSKLFYNVGCTPGFHVPLRSRVPYSSPLADILDPLVQHPWERSKSLWLTVACVLSERRL